MQQIYKYFIYNRTNMVWVFSSLMEQLWYMFMTRIIIHVLVLHKVFAMALLWAPTQNMREVLLGDVKCLPCCYRWFAIRVENMTWKWKISQIHSISYWCNTVVSFIYINMEAFRLFAYISNCAIVSKFQCGISL